MEIEHLMLTRAENAKQAEEYVDRFFRDYELVFYEGTALKSENVISASSPMFWEEVNRGISRNRTVISGLLSELSREGYGHFADLAEIPQGYLSKIFHTLAHLLDGFFGVDSRFYNLPEDSHWISKKLRREIEAMPGKYWLVKIIRSSSGSGSDSTFSFRQ